MRHERDIDIAIVIVQRDIFPRFTRVVGRDGGVRAGREVGLVADISFAVFAADEEPAEAAADGFDKVPGVEGIEEGLDAEAAAFVGFAGAVEAKIGGGGGGEGVGLVVQGVYFPWVGPEMEDTEEGHFNTEQHGGNADSQVWVCDAGGWLDGAG